MKTTTIAKLLTIITIVAIGYFALPKLIGLEQSVKGFSNFNEVIGIPNNIARYVTGVVELITAILLILSLTRKSEVAHILGYLLLTGTMLGGLLTEYLIRPEPKMMLVYIAIALLIIAVYQLLNTYSLKTVDHE
ncbi:DoxX-like protein [Dokdonia sp. Hel_I_63]|uniref:DoxX family protein n=1 Tax=Dokdonia sp. Hel_I_63 TaxID=1249996 RepID=UPI00119AB50C|nr:DoxX family protein [Dokdonia sp. Hel_I_63]TVZ22796.1 DoxX-like protein [Dokdonia sp. Hel_I_63]